jgi:hypothetical protein
MSRFHRGFSFGLAGLVAATSAAMALADNPLDFQVCSCCVKVGGDVELCSRKICPSADFCGCDIKTDDEGNAVKVRAKCVKDE